MATVAEIWAGSVGLCEELQNFPASGRMLVKVQFGMNSHNWSSPWPPHTAQRWPESLNQPEHFGAKCRTASKCFLKRDGLLPPPPPLLLCVSVDWVRGADPVDGIAVIWLTMQWMLLFTNVSIYSHIPGFFLYYLSISVFESYCVNLVTTLLFPSCVNSIWSWIRLSEQKRAHISHLLSHECKSAVLLTCS